MDRCCGNCIYSSYDSDNGYMCENEDSVNYTDFVDRNHVCEDYEEK